MRKYFATFYIALSAFLFLLTPHALAAEQPAGVRISAWHLPLNIPSIAANEWGTYRKAFPKSDVTLIPLASGPKQLQALAANQIDIVEGIGAAAFITAVSNGLDAQIIGVNSRSPRAFAVMTKNAAIKSVADLRNKRVAGLRASVVHQLFILALKQKNMTENDVEFFPMPVNSATSALLAGKVDAALLVGYEVRRAQQGGARTLVNGENHLLGLSLIVARKGFIQEHPDAVHRFLEARAHVVAEILKKREPVSSLVAQKIGISQKDVLDMWRDFNFSLAMTPADLNELRLTSDYLMEQKLIRKRVPSQALIYTATSLK